MAEGPKVSSTARVVLREVTEDDLPAFFEHQLDPEATRMAAFPSRDLDAFMSHWRRILADPTVVARTVVFDGQVAGNVGSWEQSGEWQVGYWIGREFWGKGVATSALSQFLRHVRIRPLWAHVVKHNIASIRVLEKCGFTISEQEGGASEEVVLRLDSPARPAAR